MIKQLHLLITLVLFSLFSFGQNDYFITDSSTSSGIKLIDGGDLENSQWCQVKKGSKTIKLSPYEVNEFGFKDGRVYISKKTPTTKKVFLERIHQGKVDLYFYGGQGKKMFYIENDSAILIELPKQDYAELLSGFTNDCSNVSDACKLVGYNKKSMLKFMTQYEQCDLKPFPHFRYGVLFGYEFFKINASDEQNGAFVYLDSDLNYFDYTYEGSYSVGLFLDHPIFVSDLSVHVELLFSKHGFAYNKYVDNRDLDFIANFTSLKVPVLLRYAYPSNKIRPFVNAGLVRTYYIKNESFLYETLENESTIEISKISTIEMLSDTQLGYSVGGGIEYKLNFKRSLFFEFRYNNQYGVGSTKTLGTSAFNLFTGINF